ncbi:unnamed protein product [Auanema sp. JU1783]|nr:unnamed protein product [Auanema sp. JU1783]
MLMHAQAATIFLFCIQYSLVINYLFRLYLIVDHTHFLRKPNLFPIICAVIVFFFSFVSSVTFQIGYSEFDPSSLPFNLSQEQLDYMSARTVGSYHLKTFRQIFYPVYFVFAVLLVSVMIVLTAFEIVRTIHKKQSLMSTGASSHHLRVLKVLTIQIVCTISISCCTPLALAFSFLIPVNSTVIYSSTLVLGTSSPVQSVLTICLNPVSRKTVLTLIGLDKPKSRKNTIRVDAK